MKKSIIITIHILYWLLILAGPLSLALLTRNFDLTSSGKVEWNSISYATIQLYAAYSRPILFYIGYFLFPSIKCSRKQLILLSIGVAIIYLTLYVVSPQIFSLTFHITRITASSILTGILLRLAIDWYSKRKKIKELKKENLESNLALLKHQLNPHFLFNTLHNIDSLIYIDKEKASKSIEKLSDIMRYMLNDAKVENVRLKDELNYLENYIALERLRLKNQEFLNFSISNESHRLNIAPMILLPFVENAFKHAVDSTIENGISLSLKTEGKQLLFFCQNSYNPNEVEKDMCNGIGLSTVKERLNLIYPRSHSLEITSTENIHTVKLELTLHDD